MEGSRIVFPGYLRAEFVYITRLLGPCLFQQAAHPADPQFHGADKAVFFGCFQSILCMDQIQIFLRTISEFFFRFLFQGIRILRLGRCENSLLVKPVMIGTSSNFPAFILFQ